MKSNCFASFAFTILGFHLLFFITQSHAASWQYENPPSNTIMKDWIILGPIPAGEPIQSGQISNQFSREYKDYFQTDFLDTIGGEKTITPQPGESVILDGTSYQWQAIQNNSEVINFFQYFGEKYFTLAYAYTEIILPETQEAAFYVGSDDSCRLWLNDKLVYEYWGGRAAQKDDDLVFVTLQEGTNRILFKVLNYEVDWGFYCKMLYPSDFPPSAIIERNVSSVAKTLANPAELDKTRLLILVVILSTVVFLVLAGFLYLRYKK